MKQDQNTAACLYAQQGGAREPKRQIWHCPKRLSYIVEMESQPAPVTANLLDAISRAGESAELSEFEVARIRKAAQSLMSHHASDAHMVLGALACELFDVDQMHERYRLAIQANPGNISALSNYSVSLSRIGLLREAVNVLHKLVEREPTNLAHLRNLVKEQFHGFMLSDAMESLKVLQKRDPNHDAGRHANIHKAAALLDSLGHAKDYGERQMGIACALLREKKLRCREFSLFVNDEFDDSTVFVQLRLFVGIEAAIGLSEELFGRLDQAIEDWNPAHLSISFEAGAPDYER